MILAVLGRKKLCRFKQLDKNIVLDTKTGLGWKAGADRNMTLTQAMLLWRMPTVIELSSLYVKGLGTRNMTPLSKTTGWWVWSGEVCSDDRSKSFFMDFYDGIYEGTRYSHDYSDGARAFAVRQHMENKDE